MTRVPFISQSNMLRIERLQAWFNGILAAVRVIGLAIGYWQLSTMRRQIDLMVLDQRAWLRIEQPSHTDLVAGVRFVPHLDIVNSGKSPAALLGARIELFDSEDFVKPLGTRIRAPVLPSPSGGVVIPPGVRQPFSPSDVIIFNESDVKAIVNGTRSIFLVVRLSYSDVDPRRYTQACYVYLPDSGEFSLHLRHNRMN